MRSSKITNVLAILIAAAFLFSDIGDADGKRRRRRKRRRKKATAAKVQPKAPAVEAPSTEPAAAPVSAKASRPRKGKKKVQVLDFSGIGIEGRLRTPQLLYFLGRVKEELHRASLEKRSFVPELVRSAEEGGF